MTETNLNNFTAADPNNGEGKAAAAQPPFKNIAIIGLGLIGASLAGALKAAYGASVFVFGADVDAKTIAEAREGKVGDAASKPDEKSFEDFIAAHADLVVIATPIAAVDGYFVRLAELGYAGVVTDTVSTKAHILEAAQELLPDPNMYIPGHPMAGSEQNGISGARADLFEGANWILCPDENTPPDNFSRLHELICGMDARVVSIPREEHDRAVAIVSHVPHMVATALMQLAEHHRGESSALMRLAAGGFKDSTRIAAGSPELWCGIAFDNSEALAEGLEEMQDILGNITGALKAKDRDTFTNILADSARARRALPAAWVPGSDKLLEVRIPMVNRTGVVAEVATIASSVGCNIQSIDIDHVSADTAVLSLILTDEGDVGALSYKLINAGYSVSFSPLEPKEHTHVD